MFYFISFMYGASEKVMCNTVTNVHPLTWQVDANKSYPGQYVLVSWQQISEEEFILYSEAFE